VVLIYKLRKVIIVLITGFLITVSAAPIIGKLVYAETAAVEIDSKEKDNFNIGETIHLKVNEDEFDSESAMISLPDNTKIEENTLDDEKFDQIEYDPDKNEIVLHLEDKEEISDVEIPILITDSGETELEVKEELKDETIKTDVIEFTVPEAETKEDDEQSEEMKDTQENDPSNEEIDKEQNNQPSEEETLPRLEETDGSDEYSEQTEDKSQNVETKKENTEENKTNQDESEEQSGDLSEQEDSSPTEDINDVKEETGLNNEKPEEENQKENNEAEERNQEEQVNDSEEDSPSSSKETEEIENEPEDQDDEQTNEESTSRAIEPSEETKEQEENVMSLASTTSTPTEVNNHESFQNALENSSIQNIQIVQDFSVDNSIDVNGNKVISGNNHTVNFNDEYLNIQGNNVMVDQMEIEADQWRVTGDSSVFFSENSEALLHLKDTSFAGTEATQSGQVAKLDNGHIMISGNSKFISDGGFEVFETQDLTFTENSIFEGAAIDTGALGRKQTINLYNSPTVTVEPNATVTLKNRNRESIVNADDGSSDAVIDIRDNATFEVIAENVDPYNGFPLINLPGENSSIIVGNNATFDVYNHREDDVGSLITMNGTLSMPEEGSKVSYWDAGVDSDVNSGQDTTFPRVLNGEFGFNDEVIEIASASATSTLARSNNPEKNGKTFEETFTGKNLTDVKRLFITPAEKPTAPLVNETTDKDTTLTGTATPGVTIRIQDPYGQTWETQADTQTGDFSVKLGEYAPYEANDQLIVKAIDASGSESVNIHIQETSTEFEAMINWTETEGILLQLNPIVSDVQPYTEYTTTIDWTLTDAP